MGNENGFSVLMEIENGFSVLVGMGVLARTYATRRRNPSPCALGARNAERFAHRSERGTFRAYRNGVFFTLNNGGGTRSDIGYRISDGGARVSVKRKGGQGI